MTPALAAELTAELRRELRGKVATDQRTLDAHAVDFGGMVRRQPLVVVSPRDEQDVAATLTVAPRHGLRVVARGAGHSPSGQALVADGIVLALRSLRTPAATVDARNGVAELPAGATWGEVEAALRPHRVAVPVLADHLGLTVGGTLSVGGYGVDSVANGAQVDAVTRLRLVTGDGVARWCSRDEEPELFRHALAGQGRVGIVTRVAMRVVPRRPVAAFFTARHAGLAELTRSLDWALDGRGAAVPASGTDATASFSPELFKAHVSAHRCVAIHGTRAASLRAARALRPPASLGGGAGVARSVETGAIRRSVMPEARRLRNLAVHGWLALHPRCRRVWCDYLLRHRELVAFAEHVAALDRGGAFAGCLTSTYVLVVRRPADALDLPFEAGGPPDGEPRFGIGLYAMVPRRASLDLPRVERAMRSCLERCLELDGRPYLYGAHRLREAEIERLYGGALAGVEALRQQFDPDGVIGGEKLRVG